MYTVIIVAVMYITFKTHYGRGTKFCQIFFIVMKNLHHLNFDKYGFGTRIRKATVRICQNVLKYLCIFCMSKSIAIPVGWGDRWIKEYLFKLSSLKHCQCENLLKYNYCSVLLVSNRLNGYLRLFIFVWTE